MEKALFFEDILDSLTDPIYILDNKGNFLFVNQSLIDLTGYTKAELLSFNVYQLFKEGLIDSCISENVYKAKKAVSAIQHVVKKDRIVKKLLVSSTPIFDHQGNIKNLVGHLRSIDEINEVYRIALEKNQVMIMKHKDVDVSKLASENIIAESPAMKRLLSAVREIAPVDAAVIIQGESGTGKEVIANCIHNLSPRNGKEMIKINCASLPETLLEAELFGYVKGSFTGALDSGKQGLIEMADGGTLFLDEIDSLPLTTQGKLLRVLETKMLQRIGSVKPKYIDFRLITATNADLMKMAEENLFRKDLFFRLNVIPLHIAPLRERREDIVPLAAYFIAHYCQKYGREKSFSQRVFQKLKEYHWPGNVRELKNFVERTIVMSTLSVREIKDVSIMPDGKTILSSEEVPMIETDQGPVEPITFDRLGSQDSSDCFNLKTVEGKDLKTAVEVFESHLIDRVYAAYQSTYKAAEVLGVNQSTIARKRKKRTGQG